MRNKNGIRRLQAATGAQPFNCLSYFMAACPDSYRSENSGAQQHEGFVHNGSSNQIRRGTCTLKRVLPEKVVSDTVEIIQATFEEIHPGHGITIPNIPS